MRACGGDGIGFTVTASPTAKLGRQPRGLVLLLWPFVLSDAGRRLEDTEAPWVGANEESLSEEGEQNFGGEKAVVLVGGWGMQRGVRPSASPLVVKPQSRAGGGGKTDSRWW